MTTSAPAVSIRSPVASSDSLKSKSGKEPQEAADLYLDLLKNALTRRAFPERLLAWKIPIGRRGGIVGRLLRMARRIAREPGLQYCTGVDYDAERRRTGMDWPTEAETMIGMPRLDNLQDCIKDVIQAEIPGDLIETGVWRGGASILMRGVLKAYGETRRCVWVADSFQGLPKPDPSKYPADKGDMHWVHPELAVGLETVRGNFIRYNLLDDQVKFLVGWFRDTLPTAPIQQLALIRLDGDLYESTMDALTNLYPKLSVGGYVIVDDYGAVPACKTAVEDFRKRMGIFDQMHRIDWTGVFWKRSNSPAEPEAA